MAARHLVDGERGGCATICIARREYAVKAARAVSSVASNCSSICDVHACAAPANTTKRVRRFSSGGRSRWLMVSYTCSITARVLGMWNMAMVCCIVWAKWLMSSRAWLRGGSCADREEISKGGSVDKTLMPKGVVSIFISPIDLA